MKILLAGEGGQGVQLAGEILALAAFNEERMACLIPNFGVEQRGGISLSFVKIGEGEYPKFDKADVLAIFCDRAIRRVKNYIAPETKIIAGPAVRGDMDMISGQWVMVNGKNLPAKVWNILILGEIIKLTRIVKKESLKKALEERLGEKFKKNPKLREINFKALE